MTADARHQVGLPGHGAVDVQGDRLAPARLVHVLIANRLGELTAGDVAANSRHTELGGDKGRGTGRGVSGNRRRATCRDWWQDGLGLCFSLRWGPYRLCSGAHRIVVQRYRAKGCFRDGEQQDQSRCDDSRPPPAHRPTPLAVARRSPH